MRFVSAMAAAILLLPVQARADAALDGLAKAMGADRVNAIHYSGRGYTYAIGQSAAPGQPWPKFTMRDYRFNADYRAGALKETMHVFQFHNPPRGGGRQPFPPQGERRGLGLEGEVAWTTRDNTGAISRGARGEALRTLWFSPHGVIKAAQAQNATVGGRAGARTVSFESKGDWRAVAVFGQDDLLERVEARVANPVLGDMVVVTTYANYKRFGGIPFPTRIVETANGHPAFELNVAAVQPNGTVDVAQPQNLREGAAPRVSVDKVADGVWFIGGGSHNSAAIEMADHVVVIEGPQGDARANPVIEAVKKAIPGKLIRHVFNTHHHFDHSGGLRAFAAEGATIVTQAANRPFYEAAYAAPWTIRPDRLAKSGKTASFATFEDKHVLSDGTRTLELYRLRGNNHATDLSIGYLPKEKILFVADAYSPRQLMSAPTREPQALTTNLWQNLERLKLDIARVVPMHGQVTGLDQLKMAAGMPHDH